MEQIFRLVAIAPSHIAKSNSGRKEENDMKLKNAKKICLFAIWTVLAVVLYKYDPDFLISLYVFGLGLDLIQIWYIIASKKRRKENLSVREARERYYPEYQYAVIDSKGKDMFLCKTYETARKKRISLIAHGKLSVCIKNLGEL